MLASSIFSSTSADWVIAVLTVFSVLLIPTLIFIVKGAMKWTRVEDRLGSLVDAVQHLVADKDRVHNEIVAREDKIHAEILETIRLDRDATDRRLRFIEEAWMRQSNIGQK